MVKVLDRESINRMVSRRGSGGVGGGGSDIDLSGYATKSWTDENYVGKEFFSSLFKAYDSNGNEVLPNDTETVIDNIKAMIGFWTEFYVSALGTGGQSTVGLRLSQLADVNVAGVTAGQVLTYSVDPTTQEGKWIASTPQSGTDMATVWSNLAANGNQQINYSHLSGAVSLSQGTITIGSASITPAVGSFLPLTGGTLSGFLSVNYTSSSETRYTGIEVTSPASESSIGFGIDNSGRVVFGRYTNRGFVWLTNGGEVMSFLDGGNIGIGTSNPAYKLQVAGTLGVTGAATVGGDLTVNGGDLTINEPNASGASALWFQSGGTTYGNLRVKASNGEFYFYNGTTGDGQSSACVNAGWFYSYGQVTALSDERKKNVVGEIELTIEQIAQARAVEFYWKDNCDKDLHVGSIAQDWQKILPQAVFEKDGELSMDYSVIALMCGITIARKVANIEERLIRIEENLTQK